MASYFSSFGGESPQTTQMVGYPESGGITNFQGQQNLGQVQSPGSGFLGGLYGNAGGNQGASGGLGSILGSILGNRMQQSPGGQAGLYGLDSLMGSGQYPHIEAIVKLLTGGDAPHAKAGGISSIVGGYTGGIVGGHGGAGTG